MAQTPASPSNSQPTTSGLKNVVLVHGGLVDGSSWARVIPLLHAAGLHVTAVQNPLTSLADDVAATTRAIARQAGPVLLVGHSWAGLVITEAGNNAQVAALAYVAAYAPEAGQSLQDAAQAGPAPAGGQNLRPDAAGFLSITPEGLAADLGPDLSAAEQQLFLATQQPLAAGATAEKVTAAAWQTKPSWYLVAQDDRTLNPDMQQQTAQRIGATTRTSPGSHLLILSQPTAVADFIIEAAQQTNAR
ncbi:MAG: alpha/beta fold hydrolase [Janthinobacterium lividum]